jgi:hypothetical protein
MTDIKQMGDDFTKLTLSEVRELQVYLLEVYGIYIDIETSQGKYFKKLTSNET